MGGWVARERGIGRELVGRWADWGAPKASGCSLRRQLDWEGRASVVLDGRVEGLLGDSSLRLL